MDVKESENIIAVAGVPIGGYDTRVVQLRAGASDQFDRWGGRNSWFAELVLSPGGFGARNSDTDFASRRQCARARYGYLHFDVSHSRPLTDTLTLTSEIRGKIASTNLLSSEQMAVAGPGAVRAFEPNAAYGDAAVILRNTLQLPEWGPYVRAALFADAALYAAHSPQATEPSSRSISSVGVEMQITLGTHLTFDGAVGYRFRGPGNSVDGKDVGASFRLTSRF